MIKSGNTKGFTLVISPLISLMEDQVQSLQSKGINAEMLSSKGTEQQNSFAITKLRFGDLDLLYVSPEKLNNSDFVKNMLKRHSENGMLARIVIDEAHCVSSWGHDFRPDYKLLENLRFDYPNIPIMALTATANKPVCLDIGKCLREEKTKFFQQSFNRSNLYYQLLSKNKFVMDKIKEIIHKHSGKSGIIYCNSKKDCEDMAAKLQELNIRADYYHAGLQPEDRTRIQLEWQHGDLHIICATIAFGMGIDKPDVRFVIHHTLPRNLEGYYQETGRAGRDGNPSECILFYAYKDATKIRRQIEKDDTLNHRAKEQHMNLMKRVVQYCENGTDCRRQQILQYFDEKFDSRLC
ncbi:ATP-dependent DNA helicase, partial [Nadsonia fulvescens var. elongata DSM 6958]